MDEFRLMVYAWRAVQQFREGGRFMLAGGHRSTLAGGLALTCCACPHPGINLPLDWMRNVRKP
jgi:hypothetical protein